MMLELPYYHVIIMSQPLTLIVFYLIIIFNSVLFEFEYGFGTYAL